MNAECPEEDADADGTPFVFDLRFPGALVGAGIELGIQASENYWKGCDVFNARNYNWIHVGYSALFGAVAPGWMSTAKRGITYRAATSALTAQLRGAKSARRIAKIEYRLARNERKLSDVLIPQVGLQGTKAGAKLVTSGYGESKCGCVQ